MEIFKETWRHFKSYFDLKSWLDFIPGIVATLLFFVVLGGLYLILRGVLSLWEAASPDARLQASATAIVGVPFFSFLKSLVKKKESKSGQAKKKDKK